MKFRNKSLAWFLTFILLIGNFSNVFAVEHSNKQENLLEAQQVVNNYKKEIQKNSDTNVVVVDEENELGKTGNKSTTESAISVECTTMSAISLTTTQSAIVYGINEIDDGKIIREIYTDKSKYNPGDKVNITLKLRNKENSDWTGKLNLQIYHLENILNNQDCDITLKPLEEKLVNFEYELPEDDYKGYLVKGFIDNKDFRTTAIDCSSDITKYPRYGYVADFNSEEEEKTSEKKINELARDYHINAFQFYDWMYKHDKLLKRTNNKIDKTWKDLFGRTIDYNTIQNQIDAVHNVNANAMAYVMSYATRENYDQNGVQSKWGLYSDKNHNKQLNVDFGDNSTFLWLFNPANENWQDYIIDEYNDALNNANFDGLQIDQMGQRNNLYDFFGRRIYLQDTFSDLINRTKESIDDDKIVTFNVVDGTVNGWGLNDVSKNAMTDFDFSEIWWKSNNYNDMKNYIEQFRTNNGGKPLVLAAYMNYKDNSGTKYEAEDANLNGVSADTDHYGYTGSGFIDDFSEQGDSIEFTINATEDGLYPLVFRYANTDGNQATRNLYIDDVKVGKLYFNNLSNWDSWSYDSYYTTNLAKGEHKIKVSFDEENKGAINLDSLTIGEFDENSVRLANATFAASGAYHIELGANDNHATMLPHEYYANTSKTMRKSLRNAMKEHYDFITAYENLLYDSDVNYGDGGNQFITIDDEKVSGCGDKNKIWCISRQKQDYQILHLINLTNENDTLWRNVTQAPKTKKNLETKYYIGPNKEIEGVYCASPDEECISNSLEYSVGADSRGYYVTFNIPQLKYWDMIYIKTSDNKPENNIYEAEDAVKNNVSINRDHPNYSGNGFVADFGQKNDTVSFNISVNEEKDYSLKFRYANATGDEATRALFVDGKFAGMVYFKSLNNWDTWSEAEKGLRLKEGTHKIVLLYGENEKTPINLDYLKVEDKIESARSLYMNNWSNVVWLWKDSFLNQNQPKLGDGPGINELRYYDKTENGNYDINNLKNYSMFLRNETDNKKYMNGEKFSSTGYFGKDGVLVNDYETYDGEKLKPQITRSYAVIPNEKFMVEKYSIRNNYSSKKTFNILDLLHVNNNSNNDIIAEYDRTNKVTKIDMTSSNQYYIAHGTLDNDIDGYQVADDKNTNRSSETCSPWVTFNDDGSLNNNSYVEAQDLSSGFTKELTLKPGERQDIYFYVAISESESELDEQINTVKNKSGEYWMDVMKSSYTDWLNEGKRTSFEKHELNDAYDNILVTIKQSTVPGKYVKDGEEISKFAAMPAATNPSAYLYKVWARDSAVSAMAYDASGHYKEAENYWYWLADRQISYDQGGWKKPGTFWTCFWIWNNNPVSFVEPEYDSIGMFLVGAYRHYNNLPESEKAQFLEKIWPAYRRSAQFVMKTIAPNGFGIADCSIWEEKSEYNAFTQALYIAGMDAAQMMAKAKGELDDADNFNGAASTMRSAVQRDSTDRNKGLWNKYEQRYNRAVSTSGAENKLHDSSSNVLITYGIIDAMSSRAKSHIDSMLANLGHDEYGIARYDNDGFYHRMPWDPAGNEVLEDEPSWPQMAMWVAMYELQSGYKSYRQNALRRLEWFTRRTAKGYMPQGECFSNVTLKPAVSTMVEPITGAAYIMTALAYLDEFDMRILPPQYNVGAYKNISINHGCKNDWEQWSNVPYYKDEIDDCSINDDNYDIDKVYMANDNKNLYIRLDTVGKEKPSFNSKKKFGVYVYSQDFKNNKNLDSTDISDVDGQLSRDMNYCIARYSDSNDYTKKVAKNGSWSYENHINNVTLPQWESESGRIELVIPFEQLSSNGRVNDNEWANMDIVLVKQDGSGDFEDTDKISVHYRKTGSNYEWLWGNVD